MSRRGAPFIVTLALSGCFNPTGNDSESSTGPSTTATSTTATASTGGPTGTDPTTDAPTDTGPADTSTTAGPGTSTTATSTTTGTTGDPGTGTTATDTGAIVPGPDPTFTALMPISVPQAFSVVSATLDGDMRDDLVISSASTPNLYWTYGANLTAQPEFIAAGTSLALRAVAYTNDPDTDILAALLMPELSLQTFLNAGSLMHANTEALPCPSNWMAVGDLDGDNEADVVVSCSGDPIVRVFIGTGEGQFNDPLSVTLGVGPIAIGLHDYVDSDALDLVAVSLSNDAVVVHAGLGTGAFDGEPAAAHTVLNAAALALGSVDDDPFADIVVVQATQDMCSVLYGRAEGLAPPDEFGCGPEGVEATLGDLNGDTLPDLVTLHDAVDPDPGRMYINVNLGGTFAPPIPYDVGPLPRGVALGNYDDDPDDLLDIAVTTGDNVIVYINNTVL